MLNEVSEDPTWWVEFIPETGKITRVSSRLIDSRPSRKVLETQNRLLQKISRGIRTRRDFVVLPDITGKEYSLVDSHEDILLPPPGRWRHIQIGSVFTSAIHLELNLEKNIVLLRLNRSQISSELNSATLKELVSNPMYSLDFYLVEDNNPDRLVEIISVDKKQLMSYNSFEVEVPGLQKFMETKNISIYGRDIVGSCSYDFVKVDLSRNLETQNKRWLQTGYKNLEANVLISQQDGVVTLTSNLQQHDIHLFGGKDKINILICDDTPDAICGALQVKTIDLCQMKEIEIESDMIWPEQPLILYRNNHINMYYKETQNANQH